MNRTLCNPGALPRRGQEGATLLVSMILLVVLTLVVVSAVKVSTLNTKMVGNMQTEKEADAAALQAIEATISSDFTQLPVTRTTALDINNSGQAGSTYAVTVDAPECTGIKPIKLSELDASKEDDQPCYASGAAQNTGIAGSGAGGNSLCSASNWDLSASATPPTGGAAGPKTHQGIAVRVAVGAAC
ncbi:MAG TPA: PilX N-terminal domain-containing pilus assembly protein [Variovorax sp.]|nr:PilX N-terminal domain-containing pilus assembly protein [Variovorax sp.]